MRVQVGPPTMGQAVLHIPVLVVHATQGPAVRDTTVLADPLILALVVLDIVDLEGLPMMVRAVPHILAQAVDATQARVVHVTRGREA